MAPHPKGRRSSEPRAILGMLDVSARPFVPSHVLTSAVPWPKFVGMAENIKESFLITKVRNKARTRIKRDHIRSQSSL